MSKENVPTKKDVGRIMKSEATKNNGQVPKGSWVGRVQSSEAKAEQKGKK